MKRIQPILFLIAISISSVFSNEVLTHIPGTNVEMDLSEFQWHKFSNSFYTDDYSCIMTTLYERIDLNQCIKKRKEELIPSEHFIIDEEHALAEWKYLLIFHFDIMTNTKYYVLFVGNNNETTMLKAEIKTDLASKEKIEKIIAAFNGCKLSTEGLDVKRAMFYDIVLPDYYNLIESNNNFFRFRKIAQQSSDIDVEVTFRGLLYNEKMKLQDYLILPNSKDEIVQESKKISMLVHDHEAWLVVTRDSNMRTRYKYAILYKKYVLVIIATISGETDSVTVKELSAIIKSIRFTI